MEWWNLTHKGAMGAWLSNTLQEGLLQVIAYDVQHVHPSVRNDDIITAYPGHSTGTTPR